MESRTVKEFVFAADVRERVAFWFVTTASFGVIAGFATAEGLGYVLRPTIVGRTLVMIPEYSPVLWLPAVLGASAWGPSSWLKGWRCWASARASRCNEGPRAGRGRGYLLVA